MVVFHLLPLRMRRVYLLALSYAFYATWGLGFAFLLLAVTILAYAAAAQVAPNRSAPPSGLPWFFLSLAVLLGALFVFKYLPPISVWLGLDSRLAGLIAPLGISYYTFRLISYVVDVRWGKMAPERSFVAFALYVAFFPQILSGPIQRAGDFLAQTEQPRRVDPALVRDGLRLILFGLFEKLVVADHLADVVSNVFDRASSMSGVAFALGAYAFAFQLYADFSGLTDIALGMGQLFGIEGPPNFDNPFYAPNIQAFWRRWHMSLTTWLSEYLFTPLHMAFRSAGEMGLVAAIFINMVAVGIWHGAKWTFVAFGVLNGIYVAVSALTLRRRNRFFKTRTGLAKWRVVLAPLVTFHLVVLAFVLFRANSLGDAIYFFRHLIPTQGAPGSAWGLRRMGLSDQLGIVGFVGVPIMEAIHLARSSSRVRQAFELSPTVLRWAAYYAMVLLILLLGQSESRKFIYAQF